MAKGLRIRFSVKAPRTPHGVSWLHTPLEKDMKKELDIIEGMFDRTTQTWSAKNKPRWERSGGISIGSAGTGDFEQNIFTRSTPFVWVSHPRRPGYATFSRDWRPKTKPRVIGSGAGAGKVVKRGRAAGANKLNNVTPREFEHEIAKRRQPEFAKRAFKTLDRVVAKEFTRKTKRTT